MRLRILFLTQIVPYPPDAGPKVKTWHVLRYLAQHGYEIHLVTFVRPEEEKYLDTLRELCTQVYSVPIRRSRIVDGFYWLRSHLTGRPFLIERDDLNEMRKLVDQLLDHQNFDVVHADQLTMTQFALNHKKPNLARIFDAHNAVWTILERMAENNPWWVKPILKLEAGRIKRYEGKIVREFEKTLAVTDIDESALLDAAKSYAGDKIAEDRKISVIPIAVDTQQLMPVNRDDRSVNILTLGTLHYPPNADGIRWFLREVFPRIQKDVPQASLTIIGKNPPPDFLEYERQHPEAIKVTGYVPSLRSYLEKAAAVVIPVRAGGGMRVRILESLAWGMPLVTTTIGLEGIEARPGEEVLVADEPAEFTQAVVGLIKDAALRNKLSLQGRRLAETRYDWQVVFKDLERIYQELERISV
jgi:glycosyltransferase involved in cell wall biosynthesis